MMKLYCFAAFQCFAGFVLVFLNKNRWDFKLKNYQIALLLSAIFYLSMIVMAVVTNLYFTQKLNAFDLDNDGFFSANERTVEQQKAFGESIRNHVSIKKTVLLGTIYPALYFLILIGPLKILNKRKYSIKTI